MVDDEPEPRKTPTLLAQVVGFDMVDDESKPERRPTKHCPPPAEWNSKHNCAYSYYAYYVYANLFVLNKFRCGVEGVPVPCAARAGSCGAARAMGGGGC